MTADSLRVRTALGLFLLLVFVLYVSGITDGMASEGTDWAMYVMHARNIATGHPYAETGYVVQPETIRQEGATTYPSGYPLLLAPVYAAFGLDLHVFKLFNDALLVFSLWPIFFWARRTLPVLDSFLVIAGLAFSRLYLDAHNTIGSDAPYQLLSFVALFLLQRIYDRGWCDHAPWKWGLPAGLLVTGTYLIRPIGMAMLVAIAGIELVRKRRPTLFLLAVFTAFVPLLLLNNLLFHKDAGYSDQFVLSVPAMASHLVTYIKLLSDTFANPAGSIIRFLLWGATLILALTGFINRVRTGITITEFYILAVAGVLSLYWMPNARYLLPILPIYVVYAFEGFHTLAGFVPQRAVAALCFAAVMLWLFPAVVNAASVPSTTVDTLIAAPRYEQMCQAVREKTSPGDLLVFWNPRVLALSTGRRASDYPRETVEHLDAYLKRVHPDYVVEDNQHPEDRQYLIPAVEAAGMQAAAVYESSEFRILRLLP